MSDEQTIDLTRDENSIDKKVETFQFQFVDCSPSDQQKSKTESALPNKTSSDNHLLKFNEDMNISRIENQVVRDLPPPEKKRTFSETEDLPSFITKSKGVESVNEKSADYQDYNKLLSDIQNGNSNIETVFIDSDNSSDEDDPDVYEHEEYLEDAMSDSQSPIKIHNNIVLTPAHSSFSPEPSPEPTDEITEIQQFLNATEKQNKLPAQKKTDDEIEIPKPVPLLTKTSTPLPVTRKILPKPLLGNQNKIRSPLQHENIAVNTTLAGQPQKTVKRYFQIPPEIMPIITKSVGPVLLNVPGIGAVLLNETVKKSLTDAVAKATSQSSIKPFSLNFHDIIRKGTSVPISAPNVSAIVEKEKEKDPLTDKKFSCWHLIRTRKRDIDGFTATDKLGFYRAEVEKSKKCFKHIRNIIAQEEKALNAMKMQKHSWLDRKQREQEKLHKAAKLKMMMNVRLVEIAKITKGYKEENSTPEPSSSPLRKRRRKDDKPQIKAQKMPPSISSSPVTSVINLDSDSSNSDGENNLLLTKKVVFLRDRSTTKRKAGRPPLAKNLLKQKNVPGLFKKRTESKNFKRTLNKSKEINYQELYKLKPCYVELERNKKVEEAYAKHKKENVFIHNIVKIFNQRIINSVEKFKNDIFPIKPFLIINEHNLSSIQFQREFGKYNIVFSVRRNHQFPRYIFKCEQFISAVELGYVKLVDSQVLCRYLLGDKELAGSYKNEADHSYCVDGKKVKP